MSDDVILKANNKKTQVALVLGIPRLCRWAMRAERQKQTKQVSQTTHYK